MPEQNLLDTLTERERDIARLIRDGLTNHEIAHELVLTHGTVKWYCGQIYRKLGVNTRSEAVSILQALYLPTNRVSGIASSVSVNLPALLTSFVGREREIADIRNLLHMNRLLTLTGAGGTGKTRLALVVADEAAGNFADGMTFVDLARVSDAALVVKTIAYRLDLRENANETLLETLKRALAEQERLLVIDNFEQVIEAAPIIPAILASAPCVKILVTSREALRVSGEQEYAVPPLTLPIMNQLSLADIRQSEAVRLFQQRAMMRRPDFALTEDNLTTVAEICLRLDGLPLAVELAAAHSRLFTPQALLARLDSRLNTLTGGTRDAPARQQTLRSTIEWSYNLLDEGEKMLFARLAVFKGGRSLEAVEAVCGDSLPIDVFNGLASLVDKNLLQQKETAEGEPRFVMLETLHEYAWERLYENGEAEAIRRRHAEYFVTLAERAEPELHLSQQQHWSQLLETERDNLRLALEWSSEGQGDITVGLRIAGALWWHWFAYGYHLGGYQWTQQLLPRMDEAPVTCHPKFLVAAGRMAMLQSDFPSAKRLLLLALEISRKVGDKRQAAWALVQKSITVLDEPDQANTLAEEGLALSREMDDKSGMATAFNALGEIARANGQDDHAKRNYEAAIAVAEQAGNIRRKYISLVNISFILQHENNHKQAIELLRRVIVLAHDMKSYNDMAFAMQVLSGSLAAVGKPERAARILGAAEVAFERMGAFLEPSDQPELDRIKASVHAQLDDATFQTAWAEGRKMTLEQALAEALSE